MDEVNEIQSIKLIYWLNPLEHYIINILNT